MGSHVKLSEWKLNTFTFSQTKNANTIRLRHFKTHNATPLEVVLSFEVPPPLEASKLETMLLNSYKDKNISGEWFMLTKEDVQAIRDFANDYEVNLW
jgi:hypothetical protein